MPLIEQCEALFGVSVAEIVTICRVCRTTAARWKRGQARMPAAAGALVRQAIYGFVPPIAGPAWAGWRFGRDGRLYAPLAVRGYEPRHILQLELLLQMRRLVPA